MAPQRQMTEEEIEDEIDVQASLEALQDPRPSLTVEEAFPEP